MLVMCQDCSGFAWGIVVLLFALVAAVAFWLGRLRARLVHEAALREARATARRLAALQDSWAWQTDAGHRLASWHGHGQATAGGSFGNLSDGAALLSQAAVVPQLHGEQPFTDLAVHSDTALQGSHGWLLCGLPRHDDLGRFAGFAGSARATDQQTEQRCAAAALPPLLAALNAPALLALDSGHGWRLLQANAAAQALWPALQRGGALDTVAAALPPALAADWSASDLKGSQAGAWRLSPLSGLPDGRRGLLLSQDVQATAASESAISESDNFSFTVSHDLRAPIRVVEGFTRIVKEDYGRLLDRVGNDHLDRVLGAAARMNLMIDALLTLARLSSQPLARQPVNLSQLAGYVVDDLRRASPEREADVQIEAGLVTRGDPTLLRLVLENLLGNAWKYSARSARTQISLRQVPHDSGPQGTAYVVRDNGAGFDMRSADRLFGLFQRLHSASEFPGHGVGLASVRRIVRRHGGDIWAEAEPGRGAAFYFTLA